MKLPPLSLDRSAGPLSRQLYEGLRDAILSGQFRVGTQMPSTRALSDSLNVSRNTVHTAFEQLILEGLLEGRQGAGTFVAEMPGGMPIGPGTVDPVPTRGNRHLSQQGRAMQELVQRWPQPIQLPGESRGRAFGMGAPADLFPGRVWRSLLVQCWDQLTGTRGLGRSEYTPLREAIAEYLGTTRGVRCAPDQVMLVSGSQQGIALVASVLLDPDDSVWVEDPGYFGAHTAFAGWGAKVVPVPVDEEGLSVEIGRKLAAHAKLAHVTPTHQFPLGKTMPLRRRADLLAWAQSAEAWILEEDYDSEFRYSGAPLAALQGIDPDQRVIYLGSFSKSMFSGLRLAYLVVPRDLAPAFRAARQLVGGPPPVLEQAVVERFLTEGHFSRHLRRMRRVYAQRQRHLIEAVRDELDGLLRVDPDETGMHLVGWLPGSMVADDVCRKAAE
ncbi:MAG: PLP-dependent aminotransferase family protein, partial [Pseudomonadales bacterium]|nr:PLP-dependent aminotransferase family protein [Pseudomonadales bacterium]